MTRSRLRAITRIASGASDRKARSLYEEVYGATPAETVSTERVRESLVEATTELLEKEENDGR